MIRAIRESLHNATHKHVELKKDGLCYISLCYRKWFSGTKLDVVVEFEDELEPICLHKVTAERLTTVFDAPTKIEMRRRCMEIKNS